MPLSALSAPHCPTAHGVHAVDGLRHSARVPVQLSSILSSFLSSSFASAAAGREHRSSSELMHGGARLWELEVSAVVQLYLRNRRPWRRLWMPAAR